MNGFRVFLAAFVFCLSSYMIYDLFVSGFSFFMLLLIVAGYVSVHHIWPSKLDKQSKWYDLLEFIFDLPYQFIATLFRAIGSIFKNIDGGIDPSI